MWISDFDVAWHEARHAVCIAFQTEAWGLERPPFTEVRVDRPIDPKSGNPLGWMMPDVDAVWDAAPSPSEALRVSVISRMMGYIGWKDAGVWPPSHHDLRFMHGDPGMEGLPELVWVRGAAVVSEELYELWAEEARLMARDIIFRGAVGDVQRALVDQRVLSGAEVMNILRTHLPIWAMSQVSSAERRGA